MARRSNLQGKKPRAVGNRTVKRNSRTQSGNVLSKKPVDLIGRLLVQIVERYLGLIDVAVCTLGWSLIQPHLPTNLTISEPALFLFLLFRILSSGTSANGLNVKAISLVKKLSKATPELLGIIGSTDNDTDRT